MNEEAISKIASLLQRSFEISLPPDRESIVLRYSLYSSVDREELQRNPRKALIDLLDGIEYAFLEKIREDRKKVESILEDSTPIS